MKGLKTLVAMQLKDKVDLSATKDKKQLFRILFIGLLKFLLVTVLAYSLLSLCVEYIFTQDETPKVLILVLGFSLILSIISCTFDLMKNLYFAEDNKVLITLPVPANKIFISKIIVFYIYELKKSLFFLLPITFSGILLLGSKGLCSPLSYFWMFIPMLFILMLPVLIGSLLSIPLMFIHRFLKQHSVLETIVILITFVSAIVGIVFLIKLIPTNIDLINQWPVIKESIREFLKNVEEHSIISSNLIYILIGEKTPSLVYSFSWFTILKFVCLIATCGVLFVLTYFLSRPLFFNMMSKNFELNKEIENNKPNKRHGKYTTFIFKEFKINLRTMSISVNYLIVYIIIPILILFLNTMYKAMDTRTLGDLLIYTFNILLICLPLLASNDLVATYYSREGRAGYMKRTKPIYALYPLFTKLFFNALFSIPTVFVTVAVFGNMVDFNVAQIIVLGFAILLLHLGHMIYSATLDIMNPQNEQYATTGNTIDNPNENKSIAVAFILSFGYALISYKLLSEASVAGTSGSLLFGMGKLLFISAIFFIYMIVMFMKRVKAFYYDI